MMAELLFGYTDFGVGNCGVFGYAGIGVLMVSQMGLKPKGSNHGLYGSVSRKTGTVVSLVKNGIHGRNCFVGYNNTGDKKVV